MIYYGCFYFITWSAFTIKREMLSGQDHALGPATSVNIPSGQGQPGKRTARGLRILHSQIPNSCKSPFPPSLLKTTWNSFHSSRAELGVPRPHFCISRFKGHKSGRDVTGRFWGQTTFYWGHDHLAWDKFCPWSLPWNGSRPPHWSRGRGCSG